MPETLRLRPFCSPARFVFKDPDTGHAYQAANKRALFDQIISYRDQNRLAPLTALEHVLENYWCHLPENAGLCQRVKLQRGFMQYVRGGIALIENLYYGKNNIVSPEEASRRARICIGCPLNVFPDRGPFIRWSDEIAEASTGGLRVQDAEMLGSCQACTCPLRAKVWLRAGFKLKPKERAEMAKANSRCWQLEEKK